MNIDQDMAARHRARFRSIHIIRIAEIKTAELRRTYTKQLVVSSTTLESFMAHVLNIIVGEEPQIPSAAHSSPPITQEIPHDICSKETNHICLRYVTYIEYVSTIKLHLKPEPNLNHQHRPVSIV